MSIRLKLDGFEEMLKKIEKAGGSVDEAVKTCLESSANIMETQLKYEMRDADVPENLIDRMPEAEFENHHGLQSVKVGYRKGTYDPKNLSDGYKVAFLNYGTPRRSKHGKIQEGGKIKLGFIARAKRKAKPKIRKAQEKTLDNILKGLK